LLHIDIIACLPQKYFSLDKKEIIFNNELYIYIELAEI